MRTLLVILALLAAGNTYAWGTATTNKGCYGIGKIPSETLSQINGFMNGAGSEGSGSNKTTVVTESDTFEG